MAGFVVGFCRKPPIISRIERAVEAVLGPEAEAVVAVTSLDHDEAGTPADVRKIVITLEISPPVTAREWERPNWLARLWCELTRGR
jgi:hypothetical protein